VDIPPPIIELDIEELLDLNGLLDAPASFPIFPVPQKHQIPLTIHTKVDDMRYDAFFEKLPTPTTTINFFPLPAEDSEYQPAATFDELLELFTNDLPSPMESLPHTFGTNTPC
jgi:hypothetical protein